MTIDTTNMCSHLQRKLFAEEGEYRAISERAQLRSWFELHAATEKRIGLVFPSYDFNLPPAMSVNTVILRFN